METSAINYRVADFLKQYPPFHAIAEPDLLALTARGRVRFHEANDYILWQGEPHKLHVFVIQQGTVSLWDEADGRTELRDVCGPGDILGLERFNDAPWCLYSARSASDVVIYAFPMSDFEELLLKYPHAREYVEAYGTVKADYQWSEDARNPQALFLHDVIARRPFEPCASDSTIRDAARALLASGSDAVAIATADRLDGIVTTESILRWVAQDGEDPDRAASSLASSAVTTLPPGASVTDAALALASSTTAALAITSDGSPTGRLHAIVTPKELARIFGDHPASILHDIRRATAAPGLAELNHRVRAFALQYLTTAASLDWVSRFVSLADAAIVSRLVAISDAEDGQACWCVSGSCGRQESLTRHAPQLVVLAGDEGDLVELHAAYARVVDALPECGYMARTETRFDRTFYVAGASEWKGRFDGWMRNPVLKEMYLARPLFDLRPVHGAHAPWTQLAEAVNDAVDRDLLQIVANDCLASLPPLTFFHDAVVDDSGEQAAVFRLEHSALQPLVDVGRVFGMAARRVLGTTTSERFAFARSILPEHEAIFRDAAETLRILLWQQARIGISQGTTGSELPPSLLSRHDRHVLKSGFRSILRLLEFTGNSPWFASL